MEYDEERLMSTTQAQPGDPFKESSGGEMPNDPAERATIVAPGTTGSSELAGPLVLIL